MTFPVQTRVVAAYLKLSGKIDLGEHKRPPHVGSVCETSPEKKILTASLCVLNSFFAESGTIFQSFLVTNFLSKNARNNLPSLGSHDSVRFFDICVILY